MKLLVIVLVFEKLLIIFLGCVILSYGGEFESNNELKILIEKYEDKN
jgi:hypothetical protein